MESEKTLETLLGINKLLRNLCGNQYDDFGMFSTKSYRNKPSLMPPNSQGRNEPCLCGSGLKYKKCCGKRINKEE